MDLHIYYAGLEYFKIPEVDVYTIYCTRSAYFKIPRLCYRGGPTYLDVCLDTEVEKGKAVYYDVINLQELFVK